MKRKPVVMCSTDLQSRTKQMPGMHWKRSMARMEIYNEIEKHELNPMTLEMA